MCRYETHPRDLKRHLLLTAERLAEILSEVGDTWIPLCEEKHSEPTYAEYITEGGELLCSGCTFCRNCGHELEGKRCIVDKCKLYLKDARSKDEV